MPLRTKVGWIAVGMLGFILFGVARYHATGEVGLFELNRMCVMMFLLWLAWPELEMLPRWLLYIVPFAVFVCAWRPQLLIVFLPLAFLYLLFRPPRARKKQGSKKTFEVAKYFKKKK